MGNCYCVRAAEMNCNVLPKASAGSWKPSAASHVPNQLCQPQCASAIVFSVERQIPGAFHCAIFPESSFRTILGRLVFLGEWLFKEKNDTLH